MTPEKIKELMGAAMAWFARLSPEEQEEMRQAQRESWVRGEMKFGTDRDEALARQKYRDEALSINRTEEERMILKRIADNSESVKNESPSTKNMLSGKFIATSIDVKPVEWKEAKT